MQNKQYRTWHWERIQWWLSHLYAGDDINGDDDDDDDDNIGRVSRGLLQLWVEYWLLHVDGGIDSYLSHCMFMTCRGQ